MQKVHGIRYVPNKKLAAHVPTYEIVAKGARVSLLFTISNDCSFDGISSSKFILATNLKGKKRMRVLTYALPVSDYIGKKYYTVKYEKVC